MGLKICENPSSAVLSAPQILSIRYNTVISSLRCFSSSDDVDTIRRVFVKETDEIRFGTVPWLQCGVGFKFLGLFFYVFSAQAEARECNLVSN